MRRTVQLLLYLIFFALAGCGDKPNGPETAVWESPSRQIDRRIEIGRGPVDGWEALLLKSYPEPVWLTGVDIEVLDKDGKPANQDLVDLFTVAWTYPKEHTKRFQSSSAASSVLFRLESRQNKMHLPPGYGIPMWSNEPLGCHVRWRSRDPYQKLVEVKVVPTFHFVRSRALKEPMKAVVPMSLFAAAPLEGSFQFGIENAAASAPPPAIPVKDGEFQDQFGRRFTEEWEIQPGETEVQFDVTSVLSNWFESDCVAQTLYAFPAVASVQLRQTEPLFDLTAGEAGKRKVKLPKSGPVHLVVKQKSGSIARGLTHLLLYLAWPEFEEFPDMLQ